MLLILIYTFYGYKYYTNLLNINTICISVLRHLNNIISVHMLPNRSFKII